MTDDADGAGDSNDASDDLADVAARAVEAGGDYLADAFAAGGTDATYTDRDVKAVADREAEERVLGVIREAFPDHAITAEESGHHDGDGYRWVVDALDGTNNFAAGIPTFGAAATVCERGPAGEETVATAVHVPVLDDLYVATRGGGVRYNGRSVDVTCGDDLPPSKATVGMIIGPEVLAGGRPRREWDAVTDSVEGVVKRGVQTWAPVVYWGLFARGALDGFVCYYPAEREQVAGELLAREAGARERSDGPLTVFGADAETCDALWNAAMDGLDGVE